MPDEFNHPNPNQTTQNSNPEFVKKPLEQPMLRQDTRTRLLPRQPAESGFKTFYRANKLYFWAFVAGLFIIAVLSFLFFRKTPVTQPKEAKVDVSIDAPSQVASGGDEVYKVTLTNQDTQTLTGLQLEVAYPTGVSYENSSPNALNLSGSLFPVPNLIPGQNAVVVIKAKVSGNVGDSRDVTFRLHYGYASLNAQFVKEQHFSVRLAASNIALSLNGPTSANNGQLVIYTVSFQNNSGNDAKGARITMTYPDGFTFASANPDPSLGSNTWDLGTFAKDASSTIQIQGTFNSVNPGESVTAQADFLILGNDGNYFTQNSAMLITAISNQPLLVTQTVTDSSNGANNIINPGDTLTYDLKYQNNASVAANNVNIVATLDSSALDLSTIQAQGAQVNNNTITWNAASVPNLQLLAPNESGNLNFTVQVKNPATKDSSKNLTVATHVKMGSNEYTSFFPGPDLSLKISSPSRIEGALTYVSGQLPPKVGTNTTYKVRFTLKNSTNDFSNTTVSAYLPIAAGGFNQSSVTPAEQRNVTFNASSGQLTWNVGALPAHTGQFSASRILEFTVTINPSSNQVNSSPTLVKTITMDATDLFTSQAVHNTTDDLTTDDVQGNGYGQGQVVQ